MTRCQRSKLLLTAFCFGLAAIVSQPAYAFDRSSTDHSSYAASPDAEQASTRWVGYEPEPAKRNETTQATTVSGVRWSDDRGTGFSAPSSKGPDAVQVKRALGIYAEDGDGLGSRELMLRPMKEGVVVGFKLSW